MYSAARFRLSTWVTGLIVLVLSGAALGQSVSIAAPRSKAIFQQVNGKCDIPAQISAPGLVTGEGVEYVLDQGTAGAVSAKVFDPPYAFTFPSVGLGEHTIDAYAIDSQGNRLSGGDKVTQIGVGDIIVAVGDSITAGEEDDIRTDDVSSDGRNGPFVDSAGSVYGGYEPILNDYLTDLRSYPQSIINAGKPGETAPQGTSRIAGVIAQHPTARTWILAYGTNDSNSGVSSATFKSSLVNMINQIRGTIPGARIYLSKVFYWVKPVVTDYHDVMGDIIHSLPNVYWGADVDTLFHINHNRYNHLAGQKGTWLALDTTHHPNGIGIIKMAMLWRYALALDTFLVTDGGLPSLGSIWADKIEVDGVDAIGLSPQNLLLVSGSPVDATMLPTGTKAADRQSFGLDLSSGTSFRNRSVRVTLRADKSVLSSIGVTSWQQVWATKDRVFLPTSREVDARSSSSYDFSTDVASPGRLALVADIAPPASTCVLNPANPGSSGWFDNPPRVTINAVDNTGTRCTVQYRWNTGPWITYEGQFAGATGKHTLTWFATDQSGNAEQQKSINMQVDATPPTAPVITLPGRTADATKTFTVRWSSDDPESGVAEFMYAVGLTPGGTEVKQWTSAGGSHVLGWKFSKPLNRNYYFSVKARNSAGVWSPVTISDSVYVKLMNRMGRG